jgi:hypothetical protein
MRRTSHILVAALAVVVPLALPGSVEARFRRVVVTRPVVRPWVGRTFFPVWNFPDPGSYLRGAAAVIDAQGRYLTSTQEAFLLREQVRAAQLDNRNRVFEQWRYERANTPTLEEQREFRRQQEFWRSWNDPPLTEIWSGKALNDLLRALQRGRAEQSFQGPTVPLDPELVRRLNLSTGTTAGSIGIFQHGEELHWPLPLQRATFDQERQAIEKLAPPVVKQVAAGKVDANAFDNLTQAVNQLRTSLRGNVHTMPSTEYIQSLRFVNQLRDAVRALQDPAAAKFFGSWTLTAQDVGELVDQLTQKGLRFAPATLGNEAHYTALHRLMATYAAGLPRESLQELRAQFYAIQSPKPGN